MRHEPNSRSSGTWVGGYIGWMGGHRRLAEAVLGRHPQVAQCKHVHGEMQQAAVQPVAAEHAPPLALVEDQPAE